MKKTILLMLLMGVISPSRAQCPMCKLAAESNLKEGGDKGLGLNTGILYLLAMPLLFGGIVGVVMVRQHRSDLQCLKDENTKLSQLN